MALAVIGLILNFIMITRGILNFRKFCKQALAILRSIPKSVLLHIK